jgi:hypothetical protein
MNIMSRYTTNVNESQEQLIAGLEDQKHNFLKRLERARQQVDDIKPKADFYLSLQRAILRPEIKEPDEKLLKLWQAFILMIKLTIDDPIRGVTEK